MELNQIILLRAIIRTLITDYWYYKERKKSLKVFFSHPENRLKHHTFYLLVAVIEAKKRKSKGRDRTCNRSCQGFRVKKSLCGSDGKTYKNFCLFNKARCKANKTGVSLTVEHTGSCRCSKVLPKCDQDGNFTKQAVCGSDNTTYESFCSFRVARCEAKQNKTRLTVLYKGECKKQKKTRVCPNLGQCYIKEQPVCGSDKKTYRNPCFFRVSKCIAKRQNQKLTIKKRGKHAWIFFHTTKGSEGKKI